MDPKHALYVLLDSNLPTGGFVASGGLESYAKHGFLSTPTSLYGPSAVGAIQALDLEFAREAAVASASTSTSTSMSTSSKSKFNGDLSAPARPHSAAPLGPSRAGPALMRFASAETDNFAASTGWYLSEAWECVMRALEYSESTDSADTKGGGKDEADITADTVTRLVSLDHTHESTLLSHVARRASRAQGMALLTLYVRGLVPPPGFDETDGVDFMDDDVADANRRRARELAIDGILKTYRRAIRLSAPGHLAVCFGVVAACLGLDLGKSWS
jgi:urease accessory protein